jgi:pimeloyl-ACP methyl ester carboxylesterase
VPLRQVPDRDLTYHLLVFDDDGRERREDDGRYSETVLEAARNQPPTDVFLVSHGWMGDVPGAIRQYDRWLTRMYDQEADREAAHARRPDWRSMVVGLHWPSKPWGNERIPDGPRLLSGADEQADEFAAEDAMDDAALVDAYARRIADTPAARAALQTIVSARPAAEAQILPPEVEAAYAVLFAESGLTTEGAGAAPGADQPEFVPERIVADAQQEAADSGPAVLGGFGDKLLDLVRMPLRQLSFWKMKDRARQFGERGAHDFVQQLQEAAPEARIHLMGHSFGCIVVSAAVAGAPADRSVRRPISTLFLVQGALSLWAFTDDIPYQRGTAGYFRPLVEQQLVSGGLVTTRSRFDTAVGKLYPLGAGVARQRVLGDDFPEFGGVGSFGAQGVKDARDETMTDDRQRYEIAAGGVLNIEASDVIRNGGGPSGAHSDISHPAVAHAFWQAVLAGG